MQICLFYSHATINPKCNTRKDEKVYALLKISYGTFADEY